MIAITNDAGDTLQLTAGQNLVTEQAVAWLADDELPGEFSYPIEAPLNEANKRFVGQGYRVDRTQPRVDIAVNVHLDGVLYRRCTFNYRVNEGKLSGFLKIDSSEFYDKIRKLSLLEALPDVVALGDGLGSATPLSLEARLNQIAAIPPGQFPCTFFPIRNMAMLEDSFDSTKLDGFVRNNYINAWENLEGGGSGFVVDRSLKSGYLICPQFYLSYVLEKIMALAGYTIESDWLYSEEIGRLTVVNLTAMSMDLNGLLTSHKLTVGLFLPDVTVSDFLKAVKGRFGLVFSFNANSKICTIVQFSQVVQAGAAVDLTPYQTGAYSSFDRDGKGFSVSEYIDEGDILYKDVNGKTLIPPAQVTGLGETAITLKAGTCQLSYEVSALSPAANWLVPTVSQAGNVLDAHYNQSDRYLTKEGKRPNSYGIKFLSYRGMTVDSGGHAYPLATPDVRNGVQAVVGSQALTLAGRFGAWRKYLRAYFYFRDQTQRITQNCLLPVTVLASLPLYRSVFLSLEDQIRRSYLISKVQAESPGMDGKALVKLEVLTLPSGIEQASLTDDPLVWVDLLLGERRPQAMPGVGLSSGTYPVFLQTVTLRAWADAQKTTPAAVTNLPVQLRQRMVGAGPVPTQEYVTTYYINGVSTLVEPNFIAVQNVVVEQPLSITALDRTIQIDPGEGYTILR